MVLAGGPRRPPNLFLAAFLFLIAGNQATEAVRGFVDGAHHSTLFLVGSVLAALDPLVLYYFLSVYPQRNQLNRLPWVALVAVPSLILALAIPWWMPWPAAITYAWQGTAVLSAFVYTALFIVLAHRLRAEENEPALRLLVPALALAALPAWVRLTDSFLRTVERLTPDLVPGLVLSAIAAFAVATAFLLRWSAKAPSHARRPLVLGTVVGALLAGELAFYLMMRSTLQPWIHSIVPLTWGAISVRWVAFGLLVSVAVLRHDMLGMSLAARRRAARVVVASLIFVAATVTMVVGRTFLPGDGIGLSVTEVAVIGGVILASRGFRTMVDRVAEYVYGVPVPGDAAAAVDAYRAAATAAAREGRGVDDTLVRLRRELGLDGRTAAFVEEMVFERAAPLKAGAMVAGRYRVERLLGRGGHATAYLARDQRLGRDVVLKEVQGGLAGDTALREARAAATVRHANVVAVYDLVERPEGALLVTEYLPGGSLEEHVRAMGPFPPHRGVPLLDGILAGLAALHERGIVHRDVKPANILLDDDGAPRVADLGLASTMEDMTAPLHGGPVRGTVAFLPPEVRRGERATPAADVYAVAVLARRCLASPLPGEVEAVVARALADDPAKRYADAADMREALAAARARP